MKETDDLKWIAGFWRRLGALFVDSIILGAFGFILGLALEDYFVELGDRGHAVGFCIALAYFGILNSRIAGGQTIGKKFLKLRVVNAENRLIGVSRSFVRYSVIGIPFFLNGAPRTGEAPDSLLIFPLSSVILGGLLSIVYLYVFNRVTRQSLHDLIVGTFVVNTEVERQSVGSVWEAHIMVVGVLFVLGGLIPVLAYSLVDKDFMADMLAGQQALIGNPSVTSVTLTTGFSTLISTKDESDKTSFLKASVFLAENRTSDVKLARELATSLVSALDTSARKDVIQIDLIYGYDIGIASKWYSYPHNFSPDEL